MESIPWVLPLPFSKLLPRQGNANTSTNSLRNYDVTLTLKGKKICLPTTELHRSERNTKSDEASARRTKRQKLVALSKTYPNTSLQNSTQLTSRVLSEEECMFKINGERFFSCPVCSQTFCMFSEVQKHINIHPLLSKDFKCNICKKTYVSKRNLAIHNMSHSENCPYVCKICDKRFPFSYKLSNHMKTHTGEKRYYCDKCDYGTQRKTYLTFHHNHHHKQVLFFLCRICGKNYSSAQELKAHKVTHGEKQFICKHCNKAFHTKRNCYVHEQGHSPNRIKLQCEICGNRFTCQGSLKRHTANVHFDQQKKLYQCEFCGQSVTSLASLNVHRRKHTGDLPFSCDMCDKSFSSKTVLIAHKRVHTGEKPFTCHLCDKSYSQQGTLNIHLKTHTAVKPYECETCLKKFVAKRLMKTHMKSHA